MSRKVKVEPSLITHLTVAAMCSVDTETLRDWVSRGIFPEPHSVFERTWLYRRRTIQQWIDSGEWPPDAKFRKGRGRARGAQ